MKLHYFADTDSLYIDLAERPGVRITEIAEGVLLDYDAEGHLVGIDIDNGSRKVERDRLVLERLPGSVTTVAALAGGPPGSCDGVLGVPWHAYCVRATRTHGAVRGPGYPTYRRRTTAERNGR